MTTQSGIGARGFRELCRARARLVCCHGANRGWPGDTRRGRRWNGVWADAIAKSEAEWEVTGPKQFQQVFLAKGIVYTATDDLHLGQSVRFHFAAGLSEWATGVVSDEPDVARLASIAKDLASKGYQLRVTRTLGDGKELLWKKYAELPDARFGLLHSSRDKRIGDVLDLAGRRRFGWVGPWYADPESSPESCRRLSEPISEFEAQGFELDHTLLVWGTDFVLKDGAWDNSCQSL